MLCSYLGISSSLQAELIAAMKAIELAHSKGWCSLWLEYDSALVVLAFSKLSRVSWKLRTCWSNCIHLTCSMQFYILHIFREGNHCADKLASFGASSQADMWWDLIPPFINVDFFRNRFNLPSYRAPNSCCLGSGVGRNPSTFGSI